MKRFTNVQGGATRHEVTVLLILEKEILLYHTLKMGFEVEFNCIF
jgi:hypothetical protein